MSFAEYILAFESILYGLIVSRILMEWNKMLQNKNTYKHYWAFYLFTVSIFLIIVYAYISSANPERYALMKRPINFLLIGVVPPTLFTFCSYQIFPHQLEGVDLKVFLLKNRWKIFIPGILYGMYFTLYKGLQSFDYMIYISITLLLLASFALTIGKYWVLEAFSIAAFLFSICAYILG